MRREDYRATWILMAGTVVATLTGFLREAALAHEFGTGRVTDIYLVAFTIPELFFVALPIILSPAFLPLFASLRVRTGDAEAWRFGLRVGGALLALLLALTALLAATAPLYLDWLAPGFNLVEKVEVRRAVHLMLPSIALIGASTLIGAALQVYRRFARPAMATATYNLCFVAVLLAAPLTWPVGRAALGVTLGATAALLMQLSLLWHYRPLSLVHGTEDDGEQQPIGVRHVAQLAGPLVAGYAVHHAILLVDRAMATTLAAGSVAILNYAYRLALVVGQLSGLAVSTALFPRMAEEADNEDSAQLASTLAGALRFVWMVGLPASAGLVILRTPLVQLLFERGAFDTVATRAVSDVLVWYALAVLADALCQPLWRVMYARHSVWTVLAVNGLQTGIRILCNVALISNFGYNGLALSAVLGLSIQALLLGHWVRRQLGTYLTASWWQSAIKVVLATALAAAATSLVACQLSALPTLALLSLGGTVGGLIYLIAFRSLEKHTW
jgi:putative peptidoglycan lipid II flippase